MKANSLHLGTIALSQDIYSQSNIGLWAFELDEGSAPRMYVDDTMLGLLGLKHQVSPEETYHAWYDHIDKDCYGLVTDAVNKMSAGEHAEVQYPWHHPDGHTIVVRCGGVRNPEYKKGIRIEGIHRDVTDVLHFDEKEVERLKQADEQLQHEMLRSEVLNYMIDHDDDPIELLKNFADRLRVLIGCDQVIYRDLKETRIMVNSPAIEKTWSVPFEYCRQCAHLDAHHPMYAGGYTEMENCQEGWQGIPVYDKCPIKSSLTRLVYCDGEIAGYLAIHYVVGYHKFTDLERRTVEEFTRILSISLSRYESKQKYNELEGVKHSMDMVFSLSSEYDPIIVLNPATGEYDRLMSKAGDVARDTSKTVHGENFFKDIGIDGSSIIHEDDKEQFKAFYTRENMMKIAETGVTQETENRWLAADTNQYRWKYNKAVRMIDDSGKAYVVVGVIDTTEKKEKELVQQEQSAFTSYFLRPYRTAYYVNLNSCEAVIYKNVFNPEHEGTHIFDFFNSMQRKINRFVLEEDRKQLNGFMSAEYIKDNLGKSQGLTHKFRDMLIGTERYVLMEVVPGADDGHVAIGFKDITEEHLQEQENQNKLLEALESARNEARRSDTIFDISDASKWTYEVSADDEVVGAVYADRAVRTFDAEANPMAWLNIIAPEDRAATEENFYAAIRDHSGKTPYEVTFRAVGRDGQTRWIKSSGRLLRHEDGTAELFGMSIDISKQIAEKDRQQKQLADALSQAQSASRAKTTFLNNMSHDIRTPMNAIIGFNQMALNEIGKDDDKVRDCLQKVSTSSNTLLNIINDILEISRIESGKIVFSEDKGDATLSFVDVDVMMKEIADEAGIDLQFSIGNIEDRYVICDFSHTSRIFTNLIGNAIKYSQKGGWVKAGCEQIGRDAEGRALFRYTFEDNGIGMSEEFQRELFKPFSRERSATVSHIQGTGLGLAVCKSLAEMMGGSITCESKKGKGSKFTLILPFKIQEGREFVDPKKKNKLNVVSFNGKRVLLVEDNEMNREIATAILNEVGIVVVPAANGDVAVEQMKSAKAGDFDLVLMDIQMPTIDGYEATRRIRALGTEISRIPIVAMTANAFEEDRKKALEAGMNEHVAKPIDIDILKETLAKFL